MKQCHLLVLAFDLFMFFFSGFMKTWNEEPGIVQWDCNLHNKCIDENPWDLFVFPILCKTETWKGNTDAELNWDFSSDRMTDNSTTVKADLCYKDCSFCLFKNLSNAKLSEWILMTWLFIVNSRWSTECMRMVVCVIEKRDISVKSF